MAGRTEKSTQKKTSEETQNAQDKQSFPLELDVRIHSIKPSEIIKGTASVNINGAFAVRGIKIVNGANGLFVSMPSHKVGEEYKDVCFPITAECRKQLNDAVIQAYEKALMQGQSSVEKHREMQQAPEGQEMNITGM